MGGESLRKLLGRDQDFEKKALKYEKTIKFSMDQLEHQKFEGHRYPLRNPRYFASIPNLRNSK